MVRPPLSWGNLGAQTQVALFLPRWECSLPQRLLMCIDIDRLRSIYFRFWRTRTGLQWAGGFPVRVCKLHFLIVHSSYLALFSLRGSSLSILSLSFTHKIGRSCNRALPQAPTKDRLCTALFALDQRGRARYNVPVSLSESFSEELYSSKRIAIECPK